MTAPRYFTNSEFSTWRRCRRQWWFAHYLKLIPQMEHISESRETGNIVHDVLADLYNSGFQADPFATVAWHCEVLRERYDGFDSDLETIDTIERYSRAMIEGYISWLIEEGADQDYTLLAAEEEVIAQIPLGEATFFLGKLDARFQRESDNARVFMDHKSVQNLTDYPKWAHLDTQFKFYHVLEMITNDDQTTWSDGGVINMLRKVLRTGSAKPPFFGRHDVRHNIVELRNSYKQFFQQAMEITNAENLLSQGWEPVMVGIHPTPSKECTWDCRFFSACQMVDDGSDLTGFLESVYRVGDPLERYVTVSNA